MDRNEYMRRVRDRQSFADRMAFQLGNLGQFYGDLQAGARGVLGTLGTSMLAQPVAGALGLGAAGRGLDAAADTVRGVQQDLTYMPEQGSVAQRGLENIGAALSPIGDAINFAGDAAYNATGLPAAGAATVTLAEMLGPPGQRPVRSALRGVNAGMPSAQRGSVGLQLPEGETVASIERRLGEGGGNPGTVPPVRRASTRFRGGRERSEFPGIYGDPRAMVESVRVAPESPYLGELFDTSRAELSQIALNRESTLPDWQPEATPARGRGSASANRIMTPSNEARLGDLWDAAREYRPDLFTGMTGWYASDPMYHRMLQLGMSPEEAAAEFARRETVIGMNSPGADVGTELNRGSRAAYLANQGRFGEFLEHGGYPKEALKTIWADDPNMAGLVGHSYHGTSQAPPTGRFLETGSLGAAAKVPSYVMAYRPSQMGFQNHYPVGDAHWSRLVGLADVRTNKAYAQSATLPEMAALARWYHMLAQRHGLTGVTGQGLHWGIGGPQTGVNTPVGAPKLELTADGIAIAAARRGGAWDSPAGRARLRDEYLMGNAAIGNIDPQLLMGMGAAGAGAAAAGSFLPWGEEQQ